MIPNPTIINEEGQGEQHQKYITLSYTSFKQLLSPPARNYIPIHRDKTKSYQLGLIDSKAAEEYLLRVIQTNDVEEIISLLDEAQNVMINNIVDSKKYTLLHLAAYNNNIDNLRLLLDHVKKQFKHKSKQIIYEWVNRQTDDGFAAFHFAAYRGNIEMIQLLENNGANIFLLNSQGMNGLHLASQGDQPKSIVFFRKFGFDFSQKDGKGGTAIHWASYYGSELALNYLLSFASQLIDFKDQEGLTALHLAAMSGNARIVKKLILKGANKNLKNKDGLTPADIAKQNNFSQIYKMLTQNENCLISYFNISTGIKKIQRTKEKMFKFTFMLFFCTGVTIYYLIEINMNILTIFYLLLEIINIILFVLLWLSNPGYIISFEIKGAQDKNLQLFAMLQLYEAQDICPECIVVKPSRSKHCDICGKCIQVYDHHCPWVNNCIGSHNHFIFFIFVIILCVNITLSLSTQIYYFVLNYGSLIFVEDRIYLNIVNGLIFFTSTLIMCLFYIPLIFLLLVQSKNLLAGKTTYERYSTQNSLRQSREKGNYSFKNCLIMCFFNKKLHTQRTNPENQSLQLYNPLIASEE